MANEATVRCGLTIINGNFRFRTAIDAFVATVTGTKGPVPGSITVTEAGTDIDLDELSAFGGLMVAYNYDAANRVEIGIYDPDTFHFVPVWELLPGEGCLGRLSRNFGEYFSGSQLGTGTVGTDANLRAKAYGGSVNIFFGAFDP